MKVFFSIILGALVFASCTTKPDHTKVVRVTRDCTGTYLQVDQGKDIFVCNHELLDEFAEGQKLEVAFDRVEKCESDSTMVCMMFHPHDKKVKVTYVEKRD